MNSRIIRFVVFSVCLLQSAALSAKMVRVGDREVDSVLLAYYNRCNKITRNEELIPTADTLFRLAGKLDDRRMQAAALSYKVDHFFYAGPKDSLFYWIDRGKEFCRAEKQFVHYYYIWNRLVSWHTQRHEFNLALNELRRLQTQAANDDFKPAIGNAYRRLGDIYNTKNDLAAAVSQYTKAIDYFESNQLEDHNLALLYCNLANVYTAVNRFDDAEDMLNKAQERIVVPSQQFMMEMLRVRLYLQMNRLDRAKELLDKCFAAQKEGRLPSSLQRSLYECQASYLQKTGRTKEALHIYRRLLEQMQRQGVDPEIYTPYLSQILGASRILRDTATYFHTDSLYHAAIKLLSSEESSIALGEFATMLDVEKLNRENTEIELAAQQQRLRYNILVSVILAGILIVSVVFGVVQLRTSRRLRHSQEALMRKNDELARSEESLRMAKNEAEQASRMKSVFIRNVTHEIHTPLNAIVGFAPLVADKIAPHDAEARAYMEIVQDNSRYLQKLVEDVLTLSDMESLAGMPHVEPVDADEVCRRSIERAGAPKPGVEVRYEGCTLSVVTNPLGLSQILTNLLHNALKFTDRGSVTLACGEGPDATAEFSVTDTGCGIPADKRELVFERFVKLDEFRQGMGLGLAVCRLIAEKLGGVLFIDAGYRDGSRFVLRIPLRPKS